MNVETVSSIRSHLALEQASLSILSEHCRTREEIAAMHKIDYAGELLREAFELLSGALRLEGTESGFYIEAGEAEPNA